MSELTDDRLREAAKAGWDACRRSVYAVCEDVISENEKHRADVENVRRHDFGRGGMSAAKSIARGFNAMEATDDDNFIAALAALRAAASTSTEGAGVKGLAFDDWWSADGVYIDPDTSDVPWFDKRRELAEAAFLAGVERGTGVWPNFVAPQKYDHLAPGWTDPSLPDFRLIWNTARKAGYAVGLHGSMKRDCDLIAVPWTEDAVASEDLIKRLCIALNAREIGPREPKPNGRVAVNLQIDGYFRVIDLSIVPALNPPAPKVTTDEAEERG